ncbi:MAG: hypothetical protein K2X77_02985 [Candidatus Obscuribacterales bacterium]|nr:hypothetical protein [Candidatus Obscuribacterales bacterium]
MEEKQVKNDKSKVVIDHARSAKSKLRIKVKELKNSNALQRKLGGANLGPSCYMQPTPNTH